MEKKGKKILSIVLIVLLLSGGFLMFMLPQKKITGKISENSGLPEYAKANELTITTYEFAVTNPDALDGVPCSCGCMMHLHDGRIHKRGLLDCFMKEDGSFEQHASNCDMCLNAALDVKQWIEQDIGKEEIITKIIAKYGAGGMGH